jgi:hypothetical protein
MAHWINIEEGTYRVEAAFLMTPAYTAVPLEDAIIEVYLDSRRERRLRGRAMVINVHLVELLEDHDDIDLLLDLGDDFKFLAKIPTISAGKAFSPDVKALLHFVAQGPLEKLSGPEYQEILSRLDLVKGLG